MYIKAKVLRLRKIFGIYFSFAIFFAYLILIEFFVCNPTSRVTGTVLILYCFNFKAERRNASSVL